MKDIEKNRKEFQKRSVQKQEILKENIKKNKNVMKSTTQMLLEKNQEKFQKVEMSKIEKEDYYIQKAELNKERMKKIWENNLFSSVEKVNLTIFLLKFI